MQLLVETCSYAVTRELSSGTAILSSSSLDDLQSNGPRSGLCCWADWHNRLVNYLRWSWRCRQQPNFTEPWVIWWTNLTLSNFPKRSILEQKLCTTDTPGTMWIWLIFTDLWRPSLGYLGHAVVHLVEVMCYTPGGRGSEGVTGFFCWLNPYGRAMVLGSTQCQVCLLACKRGRWDRAHNFPVFTCRLSRNSRYLNLLEP